MQCKEEPNSECAQRKSGNEMGKTRVSLVSLGNAALKELIRTPTRQRQHRINHQSQGDVPEETEHNLMIVRARP